MGQTAGKHDFLLDSRIHDRQARVLLGRARGAEIPVSCIYQGSFLVFVIIELSREAPVDGRHVALQYVLC